MKKIIFLFTILAFTSVQPQTIQFSDTDHLIIQELFSGNWEKSDSLINSQLMRNPDHPKYYFMKAYISFWNRYTSQNGMDRAESIRNVFHYGWEAIQKGEQTTQTTESKFYTGAAYALLSRANVMSRDYWTAYWNAGESEDYFEDVLEEDASVTDAYLNLGINEYFPDVMITGFQGFLAWVGGMSGDREKGLEYIEKAAAGGTLFQDEAKYALGIIYGFRENNNSKSLENWRQLNEKYPTSVQIKNSYDRTYFVNLIDERGTAFLEAEFDSLQTTYAINSPFILNTAGYNFINQQRLEEALQIFKINIRLYPTVANGYDSLAECYLNLGDHDNAVKFYKTAYDKLDADDSINEANRENAKERITGTLSDLGSSIN